MKNNKPGTAKNINRISIRFIRNKKIKYSIPDLTALNYNLLIAVYSCS